MGKTPKPKNVDYRDKSQLQPKVLVHRPKNSGLGRKSIPDISEQSASSKRRMKLTGSLSRKSPHGKSFRIKVSSSSIAEQATKVARIQRMAVVAAEASESLITNHQSDIVLQNGKEDSQGTGEENGFKEEPIANGAEVGPSKLSKSEMNDVSESSSKKVKEINSPQEALGDGEPNPSVKVNKEEEGESKKQRSGTPQSRSSTPQRKSGRVRSKHGSPNKSTPQSTAALGLKILKINLTPTNNITNGTVDARAYDNNKAKVVETAEPDCQKTLDTTTANESDDRNIQSGPVQSEKVSSETESPKARSSDANAPYLRSLRMISGRRSLTSSPSRSLTGPSTSGSNTASSTQWRKKQSRKKDGVHMKDESEAEYQGTENEFNSSANAGKRKAEMDDDQGSSYAVINVKKPKNEEDDIKLFLSDESEEYNLVDNSEGYLNSSQQSKSSDDFSAELKDLNESASSDDNFVKDESMEYAYEAREVDTNTKSHDFPTTGNQCSNKRWCILM